MEHSIDHQMRPIGTLEAQQKQDLEHHNLEKDANQREHFLEHHPGRALYDGSSAQPQQ